MSKLVFGAVLLLAPSIRAADTYTPLNIKPGEWEVTRTTQSSGAPPIPAQLLDKLTPEQKARMEAAMKARAARGPITKVDKRCIKKEDLEKPMALDENRTCKPTILTSNRTTQDFRLDCALAGANIAMKVHVEAQGSESFKATLAGDSTDGTRTMISEGTYTGKWIGPACAKDE